MAYRYFKVDRPHKIFGDKITNHHNYLFLVKCQKDMFISNDIPPHYLTGWKNKISSK